MSEKYLGYVCTRLHNSDESKGDNAIIRIIAKRDTDKGKYIKLTAESAKILCPPNGTVFGPLFFSKSNMSFNKGTFIEFSVKRGEEKEVKGFNDTEYIIDYFSNPRAISLPRLVSYNGKLIEQIKKGYFDPREINSTINKEMFGKENTVFFLHDQKSNKLVGLLKYDAINNDIKSNYGKEVQEFDINPDCIISDMNGIQYALLSEKNNELSRGVVLDYMSNHQLSDWFKNFIGNISGADRRVISKLCEIAEAQSLQDDLDVTRLERIKSKYEALEIDEQIMMDVIMSHPKYFERYDEIESEISKKLEKKYLENASEEIQNNIKKIDQLKNEIQKLYDEKNETKKKIDIEISEHRENLEKRDKELEIQIKEKEKRIKSLNENYDSVIATISAISPILSTQIKNTTAEDVNNLSKADFPKDEEARPYSQIREEDEESFISFMKRHACYSDDRFSEYLKQVKRVFSHKACFIPNPALAYLFAKALRNTEVLILHIEHDWLHYSDFVNHGLLEAFNEANENPKKNYILVLDGLNITQPECGLRPLLNLINGDVPRLKGCQFGFPNNMTIMATLLSSSEESAVGLKLNPFYFNKWFAVGNPLEETDKVLLPENFEYDEVLENIGYVEPSDLPKEVVTEKAELLDKYLDF